VTPRLLIVEDRAHETGGHFPVRAAQLADTYTELGYDVELLTSQGWSRAGEHPDVPFAVHRYRSLARWLDRRLRHPVLRSALQVVEIRARSRRSPQPPAAVIVLTFDPVPMVITLGAPRRARWLINAFRDPRRFGTWHRLDRLAAQVERSRRASGGCIRLAVAHPLLRETWCAAAGYLDPVVMPIAGVRRVDPAADARVRLGIPRDAQVALLFGDPWLKRREVVMDAFAELDDWILLVGGHVADGLESSARVITFPPAVSDGTRDLLFAAADLVVLSFIAGYVNNSGTLMDAISFGVPVVCSDDAAVAEAIVTRYRVGVPFVGDDPRALIGAVRAAPRTIAAADLRVARDELSNVAVVRRQLETLGIRDACVR
jgi:glycosyltransferase involved in cell wall biosynthesis